MFGFRMSGYSLGGLWMFRGLFFEESDLAKGIMIVEKLNMNFLEKQISFYSTIFIFKPRYNNIVNNLTSSA